MTAELWIKIGYAIGGFVFAAIPLIISIIAVIKQKIKAKKALKEASTEAEKEKAKAADAEATADMLNKTRELIQQAEKLYATVDTALKSKGQSAGAVKKDSVLSKLQLYALDNGYTFDSDKWSSTIDEIVTMTKNVNAK